MSVPPPPDAHVFNQSAPSKRFNLANFLISSGPSAVALGFLNDPLGLIRSKCDPVPTVKAPVINLGPERILFSIEVLTAVD